MKAVRILTLVIAGLWSGGCPAWFDHAPAPVSTRKLNSGDGNILVSGALRGHGAGWFIVHPNREQIERWEWDKHVASSRPAWSPALQRLVLDIAPCRDIQPDDTRWSFLSVDRDGTVTCFPLLRAPGTYWFTNFALTHGGSAVIYWPSTDPSKGFVQTLSEPALPSQYIRLDYAPFYLPAVSPDSALLAFSTFDHHDCRGYPLTACPSIIYRMRLDDARSAPVRWLHGWVAKPGSGRGIKWSPSGGTIAVLLANPRTGLGEVWAASDDGSLPHRVLAPSTHDNDSRAGIVAFDWSPDGSQIVYASDEEGSCHWYDERGPTCNYDIYIANADGSKRHRIARLFSGVGDLFWTD